MSQQVTGGGGGAQHNPAHGSSSSSPSRLILTAVGISVMSMGAVLLLRNLRSSSSGSNNVKKQRTRPSSAPHDQLTKSEKKKVVTSRSIKKSGESRSRDSTASTSSLSRNNSINKRYHKYDHNRTHDDDDDEEESTPSSVREGDDDDVASDASNMSGGDLEGYSFIMTTAAAAATSDYDGGASNYEQDTPFSTSTPVTASSLSSSRASTVPTPATAVVGRSTHHHHRSNHAASSSPSSSHSRSHHRHTKSVEDEEEEEEEAFQARRNHHNRGRRPTVCGVSTNLDETRMYEPPESAPKTEVEEKILLTALRRCHLFAHLDDDELKVVVNAMCAEKFHRGHFITRQAELMDMDTHNFYVIVAGEVSVIVDGTVTKVLTSGCSFGENHIMFVQPRAPSSHRVDSDLCSLFSLTPEAYRHIVTRAAVSKRELYEGFLDRVSWLKGLTHMEKIQLADCLQPVVYHQGEYLIEYNTIGDFVYIILEGTVDVYGRDHGEVMYVCSFSVGDCVGELEFINHHRTVADVRSRGVVKAARLHRDHFEMCMGPIVDILRRTASMDDKYSYYQNAIRHMRRNNHRKQQKK